MKKTIWGILAACGTVLAAQAASAAQSAVTQSLLIGPLTVRSDYTVAGSSQALPRQNYDVQASASLFPQVWTTICSTAADENGLITFSDLDAPKYQMRFYRLALGSAGGSGGGNAPGGPPYLFALKAKQSIVLNGNAQVDSFDSADTNYSLNGLYDPARHKARAYLVSESAAAGSTDIGTGTVFGYVSTWGGSGTVSITQGEVGDNDWVNNWANRGTIELGHFLNNNFNDIADVVLPAGLTSASGRLTQATSAIGGTNYSYQLGDGTVYVNGNFNLSGQQSLVVTGKVIWYVAGSFSITGNAFVYLSPGAKLTLYVGRTSAKVSDSMTISGRGIANGTGYASNLAIYGLPSVKKGAFSGNAAFVGTGNMPEANVTFSGNAGASGAFIGNSFTFTGNAGFHYDESLGRP
jgi:hypothetical protein